MGIFQIIARQLNISIPFWMHGPSLALVAISIFTIWQTVGYDIVIFLAGLTNIPGEIYEAARLDGANSLQLFRFITFPLLSPTFFFVLVISVIGSFQSFNQIYSMNTAAAQTLGGPLGTTYTLTVYMFDQLYTYSNYGYASAVAVLLSALILILTLANFRLIGRGRNPGGGRMILAFNRERLFRMLKGICVHLILLIGAFFALFPFVWMVLTSLKSYIEAFPR